MKLLSVLATLSALLIAAAPAPSPAVQPSQNARLLFCGGFLGTAFVVGKDTLATARHLTHGYKTCIDAASGAEVDVVSEDAVHDFSIVRMDTGDIQPLKYSCKRYKKGKYYSAYGYAHGDWTRTLVRADKDYTGNDFEIEGTRWPGMRELTGATIAGMSGGPIVDDKNNVVGMVNAGDSEDSVSYELADTPLCRR